MRVSPKWGWFAAFTAVFAVCAAVVFWGTWSPEMAPVMPDCPTSYPVHWFRAWLVGWLENGKFAPAEAINWIGSPYIWTEFQYAFAAYMSALGMVYFLRGRGLPRVAAYGAGLLLAFSGYWFTLFSAGHLGWFQWMTYGVFVFGLIDRALEKGKPRHWLLLGACLAWGSMRQADLWLLFSVFSAAYFVFRLAVVLLGTTRDARRETIVKWTKGSTLALVALLAIGGASFRSAFVNDLAGRDKQIEEGQTVAASAAKDDAEKRWIFVTNWSMPPEATKEFWHAGVEGDTSCPYTLAIGTKNGNGIRPYTGRLGRPIDANAGNYRQHSLYVGWMTCLLALLGVATMFMRFRWPREPSATGSVRNPSIRQSVNLSIPRSNNQTIKQSNNSTILFFAVSAVVFWLFSMGRYCEPVYRLVYALPFGDYLRAPVKWHHLTEFCLCVLAGYGLAGIWRILNHKLRISNCMKSDPPIHHSSFIIHNLSIAVPAALVVVGVICLVSNARLYCAPHRADADMQFADARITQDPRGIAQLNQMRARVLGQYGNMALVEIPHGPKKDERPELPSPQPITLALGILSLVGTAFVGVCGVTGVFQIKKQLVHIGA